MVYERLDLDQRVTSWSQCSWRVGIGVVSQTQLQPVPQVTKNIVGEFRHPCNKQQADKQGGDDYKNTVYPIDPGRELFFIKGEAVVCQPSQHTQRDHDEGAGSNKRRQMEQKAVQVGEKQIRKRCTDNNNDRNGEGNGTVAKRCRWGRCTSSKAHPCETPGIFMLCFHVMEFHGENDLCRI